MIQLFDKFKNMQEYEKMNDDNIIQIYVFSVIIIAILNYVLIFPELVTKILNI